MAGRRAIETRPAGRPNQPPSRRRRGRTARRDTGALTEVDLRVAQAIADARRYEQLDRPQRRVQIKETGGSTLWRNRRQLAPHLVVASVLATGAALRGLDQLIGHALGSSAVYYAVLAVASVVAAVVIAKVAPRRWRRRAVIAVAGGVAWIAWTTAAGMSWTSTGLLLLAELALAARWWQERRLDHPTGKPAAPLPKPVNAVKGPDRDNIPGLWDAYIGSKDGALAGSYLHTPIVDDHRESYTVELVPGKHSLDKALANLDRIQSGLRRPQEEIILEPHPSGDSAQIQLTIVTRSPIKETVHFTGPQYFRDGLDSWIEPGRYADGEGRVRVSVYAPNSARHMVVFGGQGSGKTALLNLMAVSAKGSGHTVVWYLDGQDGASSPQLRDHADWAPTGETAAETMLRALEKLFAARGLQMKANRLAGLTPSPDLPGLIVIIDECHLVFNPDRPDLVKRWTDLAAIARKLCVAFWAATQHPELASFGNADKLRSLLMQYTTLVLRTTSGVASNILRLQVDPSKLPTLPGYGYVVAGDKAEGVRSAPFRADFLDDADGIADQWFEQYPGCALDQLSGNAAGRSYIDRAQIAEQLRKADDDQLAALVAACAPDTGATTGESHAIGTGSIQPAPAGPLELAPVTAFPQPAALSTKADTTPGPAAPTGLSETQEAIWRIVATGAQKAADIAAQARLSASQTYKLISELVDAGHLVKVGHGRYRVVGLEEDTDQ